ncbi:hypothetical protein HU200_013286 [Digitaria exilis]|uniref:Leucine-rich repeat-containing N-terminal plant-type domain-containing protein n=1 Tax=Digitaria exilis TaxID=1010633 RepID=A0A835KL54_9POAL|nr:hypothetical protein HU200_013286 [Digitaria exilis]
MSCCTWCLCFLLCLRFLVCNACLHKERSALVDIGNKIGAWTHPSDGNDCCRWDGVTCSSGTGRVTGLDLTDLGGVIYLLNATWFLPFEELQSLSLSNLAIQGCLPGAGFEIWSSLHKLEILDLSNNQLNDSAILFLDSLPSLRSLFLNTNLITSAQIVKRLSKRKLEVLDLSWNVIVDNISTVRAETLVANISIQLQVIELSNCNLNANFDALQDNNDISGEIPTSICENSMLGMVDISNNSHYDNGFQGTLLEIDQEEFTTKSRQDYYKGSILSYMSGLDFSSNQLKGSIPECIGSMQWLRALNFSNNSLSGPIPMSLYNLSNLESLDLSHNSLAGQIPSELAALHSLEVFSVAYNNLSGPTLGTMGQFITFGQSCYEGNPGLCGRPLPKNCSTTLSIPLPAVDDAHDRLDDLILFGSLALFYAVGFWTSLGVLYFKSSWRWPLFSAVDRFGDFLVARWAILMNWPPTPALVVCIMKDMIC